MGAATATAEQEAERLLEELGDFGELAEWALSDPDSFLAASDKVKAERSLAYFIKLMWPVLEPATPLVWGWAFDAICLHLEAVTAGKIRRLLINIPPGFSKSLITNVFWPAWEWARGMVTSYLSGSHNKDLSVRDSLKLRTLITSEAYQSRWGDRVQLTADQAGKERFNLVNTGFKLATSSRSMTGERASRVCLDDPHSVEGAESDADRETTNRVFRETVPSRLKNPETDAIIVIMQRVHEEDVASIAIGLGYTVLCLPMEFESEHPHHWVGGAANDNQYGPGDPRTEDGDLLCPERYSARSVAELKAQLSDDGGDYAVVAQLQQRPAPRGGGMFQREWLIGANGERIVDPEDVPDGGVEVRGWDLAYSSNKKAAFTEGVRIKLIDGILYIMDNVGGQLDPHGMEELIASTAENDGQDVEQSIPRDPAAGAVLEATLSQRLHGYRFEFSPEKGEKANRAAPVASQAKAGNVRLVRGPWNKAFVAQLIVFPAGKRKDKADALSRAYARAITMRRAPSIGRTGFKSFAS